MLPLHPVRPLVPMFTALHWRAGVAAAGSIDCFVGDDTAATRRRLTVVCEGGGLTLFPLVQTCSKYCFIRKRKQVLKSIATITKIIRPIEPAGQ